MDLNQFSVLELKALCYDQDLQRKVFEQNIKNIEETIVKKIQEEQLVKKLREEIEVENKKKVDDSKKSDANKKELK